MNSKDKELIAAFAKVTRTDKLVTNAMETLKCFINCFEQNRAIIWFSQAAREDASKKVRSLIEFY